MFTSICVHLTACRVESATAAAPAALKPCSLQHSWAHAKREMRCRHMLVYQEKSDVPVPVMTGISVKIQHRLQFDHKKTELLQTCQGFLRKSRFPST